MEGKQALSERYHFHSTREIIRACEDGRLPDNVMFNFHPQRWTDSPGLWAQELVLQNVKNVAKWVLRRVRGYVAKTRFAWTESAGTQLDQIQFVSTCLSPAFLCTLYKKPVYCLRRG